MFKELKKITQEEIDYTPSNWDFIISLIYCIILLPFNIVIDIYHYVEDKYFEMLAYYCQFKKNGER